MAATATKLLCPRSNCGEELIFSYHVGSQGRLFPIYWCIADGNHYVGIHNDLVPLIPVLTDRRMASAEQRGEE